MKTCATCLCWRKTGTTHAPRRLVHDSGVIMIPAGEEGQCRFMAPPVDFRWPLTMAGDWCRQHAPFPFNSSSGLAVPRPPADDALAALDRELTETAAKGDKLAQFELDTARREAAERSEASAPILGAGAPGTASPAGADNSPASEAGNRTPRPHGRGRGAATAGPARSEPPSPARKPSPPTA